MISVMYCVKYGVLPFCVYKFYIEFKIVSSKLIIFKRTKVEFSIMLFGQNKTPKQDGTACIPVGVTVYFAQIRNYLYFD